MKKEEKEIQAMAENRLAIDHLNIDNYPGASRR